MKAKEDNIECCYNSMSTQRNIIMLISNLNTVRYQYDNEFFLFARCNMLSNLMFFKFLVGNRRQADS